MRKFLKIVCVLLCLVMAFSAFYGCQETPQPPDDSQGQSENPDDPATPSGEQKSLFETMQEKYPGYELTEVLNDADLLAMIDVINQSDDPIALTGNRAYYLAADIDLNPSWNASPAFHGNTFQLPYKPATIIEGIKEFGGIFDGNGHTISGIYINKTVDVDEASDESETANEDYGFINHLNGGTITNINFENSFIYAALEGSGNVNVHIGGLVGRVTGDNAVIKNVTVAMNTFYSSDETVSIAGVVGAVDASGFSMNDVTFRGKAGAIGSDNVYPSTATEVILAQMIGEGNGCAISMTDCTAGGTLIFPDGALGWDEFCAGDASGLSTVRCQKVAAPEDEIDVYEIYIVDELLAIATSGKTYEGKTIKLMNNIDLNPDWSVSSVSTGKSSEAPAVIWPGIANFAGTFDGNAHSISGLYRKIDLSETSEAGLLIDTLSGGCVKNLSIRNSGIIAVNSSSEPVGTVRIGGVVGVVEEFGSFENLLLEETVRSVGACNGILSGCVAYNKANSGLLMDSVGFFGTVSAANNAETASVSVAGLIGSNEDHDQKAVLENCVSVGSLSAAGGSSSALSQDADCKNCLTEKEPNSFAVKNEAYKNWTYVKSYGTIMPDGISFIAESGEVDISWYRPQYATSYIRTASELMGLSYLADVEKEDFAGKTIRLMANINLNPLWDASTEVKDGNLVLPDVPQNQWTSIANFAGIFDGNGYAISGLYITGKPSGSTSALGFITNLRSGVVQNLIVKNSCQVATPTGYGTANMHIGGFICEAFGNAPTIENVYVDMDCWTVFNNHFTMGGVLSYNSSGDSLVMKDCVYAGNIGNASTGMIAPYTTESYIYMGGVFGMTKDSTKEESVFTLENCLFIGTLYCGERCVHGAITNNGSNGNKYAILKSCYYEPLTKFVQNNKTTTQASPAAEVENETSYKDEGWIYFEEVGSLLPPGVARLFGADAAHVESTEDVRDINVEVVKTADDLLELAKQAQAGETFEEMTIYLDADIDLNPGWSATPLLDAETHRVTFPETPENVWTPFPDFKGTFNGNGHMITGLYTFYSIHGKNSGNYAGFIERLSDGGTIKNLIIANSILRVDNTGSSSFGSRNNHIGGLVATTAKSLGDSNKFSASVINVYSSMEIWLECTNHATIGGILAFDGKVEVEEDYEGDASAVAYDIERVVFAGRIGHTDYTHKVPYTSPKEEFAIAQIVADNNWSSASRIYDCLAIGRVVTGNENDEDCHIELFSAANWKDKVKMQDDLAQRYNDLPELDDCGNKLDGSDWVYDPTLEYYLPQTVEMMISRGDYAEELRDLEPDEFDPIGHPDEIHVSTADELIALASSDDDFMGKTIYLDADIDFNPGKDLSTKTMDGKVVFPDQSGLKLWKAFSVFKGTIDGQGHTIKGLYSYRTVAAKPDGTHSSNAGDYGGLIDAQRDGSVRNLVITNSILIVDNTTLSEDWGSRSIHIGGLFGGINKTSGNSNNYGTTITNLYSDMEVWLISQNHASVGGLIGQNGGTNYYISSVVFAGKVGNTNKRDGTGSASFVSGKQSELVMAQIVGDHNWKTGCRLLNTVAAGSFQTGSIGQAYVGNVIGVNYKDKISLDTCIEGFADTLPEGFSSADWKLSSCGYYFPSSVAQLTNELKMALVINGETVSGYKPTVSGYTEGVVIRDGNLSITIPEGVKHIAASAFSGIGNLRSISLPDTLLTIGSGAFQGCTGLTSVSLPDGLTEIGSYAFDGCTGLEISAFPAKLAKIGAGAFTGCEKITEVVFENDGSVTMTIASDAFGFDSLTKITADAVVFGAIDKSLKGAVETAVITGGETLASGALAGCSSMTELILPDSLTEIKAGAFENCSSLSSLTIPKNVTVVESGAFKSMMGMTEYCVADDNTAFKAIGGNLYSIDGKTLIIYAAANPATSFTIPEDVTEIGAYAFYGVSQLEEIIMPAALEDIGESALVGTAYYRNLETDDHDVMYFGTLLFKATKNYSASSYTVKEGTTKIANGAFALYTNLKEVTLPDSIETIGETAFDKSGVTTVHLPASLLSVISEDAAKKFINVDVVSGSIGESAFENFSAMTALTISGDVTSVDNGAFTDFAGTLKTLKFPATSLGVLGKVNLTSLETISMTNNGSVVEIPDETFAGCTALKEITIPEGVTKLGVNCFSGCTSLKTVTLSSTVTTLSAGCFAGTAIQSFKITKNVSEIQTGAFDNCASLATFSVDSANQFFKWNLNIGLFSKDGTRLVRAKKLSSATATLDLSSTAAKAITSVDTGAFSGLTVGKLKTTTDLFDLVVAAGFRVSDLTSLEFTAGTTIASGVMKDCTNLTTLKTGNTVTTIGASAFEGCTALKTVTLGTAVATIGDAAFKGCTTLIGSTSGLTIPATVTSIGASAFEGCSVLAKVIYKGTVKPSIGTDAFKDIKSGATLPTDW